jgi:putative peptidoglycan lipid II flippase
VSASRGRALGVSTLNLASKGLAIAKTMLISALFGASASLDAFWVAYSLPTLLPAVLTTVITVAFVPRFMSSLEGRSGPEAWRGANTLFTLVMLVSVVAAALMSLYAPALVRGLAPGLAEPTHAEAVRLTRLLMPCVPRRSAMRVNDSSCRRWRACSPTSSSSAAPCCWLGSGVPRRW